MLRLIVRRPLAVAAAAATGAAGVASARTVCDSAALVAKQNSSKPESVKVTPFSLGGEQHDQSTFVGRLTKIQELIDMRTIFLTDADVAAAQARLNEFKRLGRCPDGVSDQDMWEAQRTVNAVVHGPTGEKMFLPGRMSMFVPMNLPITAGMVLAASQQASMRVTLLLQWANQTYNVVNNYVCRAGPEVAYGPLAQSYGLAVTASCSIAMAAGSLLSTYPGLRVLGPLVPYLAVISAGTTNVCFTRMDEIKNGIEVSDADGNPLGRSVAAGQTAVFRTVTTRSMFLPVLSLLFPPAAMRAVYATGLVSAGTAAAIAIEVAAVGVGLAVGLPAALALQPLQMELDVGSLEPQFQGLKRADGSPCTHVYASKGM
mmetsp:Transcript_11666/g.37353  ORF Transcript_11666/g.37353 Transcript_11666/m.37353 type:complete len:372 (+) Transcript_11666:49-1164(+)